MNKNTLFFEQIKMFNSTFLDKISIFKYSDEYIIKLYQNTNNTTYTKKAFSIDELEQKVTRLISLYIMLNIDFPSMANVVKGRKVLK